MEYGYCRANMPNQKMTLQKKVIKAVSPNAKIYADRYRERQSWKRLLENVQPGDSVVFDSIRSICFNDINASENYRYFLSENIDIFFCKQPFFNSGMISLGDVSVQNEIIELICKQVDTFISSIDLGISIGMKMTKKQVGRKRGEKYDSKSKKKAIKKIREESISFNGTKKDSQLIEELRVSRNTYYKYKAEIRRLLCVIDDFHGDYFFLSNYYPIDLFYRGLEYHSVEAAYQSQKFPNNISRQYEFSAMHNPNQAKSRGSNGGLPPNWDVEKNIVMEDLVRQKFNKNEKMKELLLSTKDAELIEGNLHHDCYWGACKCDACKEREKRNELGKLLMKIRDEIRNEKASC